MAKRSPNPSTSDGGFWTTIPGILTGIAAVLTAAGTLIGVLYSARVFSSPKDPAKSISPPPKIVADEGGGSAQTKSTAGPNTTLESHTASHYPVDLKLSGTATAGDYHFQILSGRLEEFGTDGISGGKTLLLRLQVKETYDAQFGAGYFFGDGFRLIIDGSAQSPTKGPIENIDHGTSLIREVTFTIPQATTRAVLRVGYYDGQRTDMNLNLAPTAQN